MGSKRESGLGPPQGGEAALRRQIWVVEGPQNGFRVDPRDRSCPSRRAGHVGVLAASRMRISRPFLGSTCGRISGVDMWPNFVLRGTLSKLTHTIVGPIPSKPGSSSRARNVAYDRYQTLCLEKVVQASKSELSNNLLHGQNRGGLKFYEKFYTTKRTKFYTTKRTKRITQISLNAALGRKKRDTLGRKGWVEAK